MSRTFPLERCVRALISSAARLSTPADAGSAGRPDHDLGAPAAHLEAVDVLEVAAVVAHEHRARRLREVDGVRGALRHALDPGGGVGGVTDHRVLEPLLGSHVARHHGAAVQADADPEALGLTAL